MLFLTGLAAAIAIGCGGGGKNPVDIPDEPEIRGLHRHCGHQLHALRQHRRRQLRLRLRTVLLPHRVRALRRSTGARGAPPAAGEGRRGPRRPRPGRGGLRRRRERPQGRRRVGRHGEHLGDPLHHPHGAPPRHELQRARPGAADQGGRHRPGGEHQRQPGDGDLRLRQRDAADPGLHLRPRGPGRRRGLDPRGGPDPLDQPLRGDHGRGRPLGGPGLAHRDRRRQPGDLHRRLPQRRPEPAGRRTPSTP